MLQDGTYNLNGEVVEFTEGYQVSFEREGQSVEFKEDAKRILSAIAPLNIGVWEGVQEFSINIKDLDLALAIARQYNQDAIWDWSTMSAIHLKG